MTKKLPPVGEVAPPLVRPAKPTKTQPEFEPTPQDRTRVETLAGYGLNAAKIGRVIFDPKRGGKPLTGTLVRRYFAEELLTGDAKGEALNAQFLFSAAEKGNVGAAIWLEKTRWGRMAPEDVRVPGGGQGGPVENPGQELTQQERAERVKQIVDLALVRKERRFGGAK